VEGLSVTTESLVPPSYLLHSNYALFCLVFEIWPRDKWTDIGQHCISGPKGGISKNRCDMV